MTWAGSSRIESPVRGTPIGEEIPKWGASVRVRTAAPMLGILGTVTGIIRSFAAVGAQAAGGAGAEGPTDPTLVADGIAQALYTTAFGLLIAIVTLFPYVIFRARIDRALGRLELLAAAGMEESGVRGQESAPGERTPTAVGRESRSAKESSGEWQPAPARE